MLMPVSQTSDPIFPLVTHRNWPFMHIANKKLLITPILYSILVLKSWP